VMPDDDPNEVKITLRLYPELIVLGPRVGMPDMPEDSCPDCGGAGSVTEDRFDRRGEHYTEEVPCATCRPDEPRPRDSEDDGADRWDRDDG